MQVRIHTKLLQSATPRRRQEWELALQDLNHDPPPGEGSITVYRLPDQGAALMRSPGGQITLEGAQLKRLVEAYKNTIDRLIASSRGDGVRSIETLDYAKKLTHDEAGEFVQETLEEADPPISLDLPTCRRLFTLIFLVVTDLPEAHVSQHRIHL